MKINWRLIGELVTMGALMFCWTGVAVAQGSQPAQGGQSQPPAQQTDKSKTPEITPLTLDVAPPVSAEEDAAYKVFQGVNQNDAAKKIEAGEAFLLKYPE